MVVGEYAVLEGAEAVVAAVSRRAHARTGGTGAAPPEVVGAAAAAARLLGVEPPAVSIDASALRDGDKKLGLGSSAAGAAAAAAVVFAQAGKLLDDAATRTQVLDAALEGHRTVAPEGSGADVAASVLGGFVRFRRLGDGVETHALDWPAALALRVVWTGGEARTSDMITRVRALRYRDGALHRRCFAALADRADATISALLDADVAGAIEGLDGYAEAMDALGRAAGVSIVDATSARVRAIAKAAGGAAKPSGAGGGDVVMAAFPDEDCAEKFASECAGAGLALLSLGLGAPGVQDESPREGQR
jgi:phosphomevalonate kinase